jgi:hypothetical protein
MPLSEMRLSIDPLPGQLAVSIQAREVRPDALPCDVPQAHGAELGDQPEPKVALVVAVGGVLGPRALSLKSGKARLCSDLLAGDPLQRETRGLDWYPLSLRPAWLELEF